MSELKKIREEINKIDAALVPLLEKRLKLALSTKKLKSEISDSKREEEILNKIQSPHIKKIYLTIFKVCKELQADERSLL